MCRIIACTSDVQSVQMVSDSISGCNDILAELKIQHKVVWEVREHCKVGRD